MAQLPEVLQRQERAPLVVDVDAGHAASRDAIAHPNDVSVVGRDVVERRIAARDVAEDQDPVRMRLLEHRAVDGRDVRAPIDMAEKEPIAASPGDLVDAPEDLRVERVADVPDDHAEQRAAAPAQRSGEEVRLIAEVRGGGEDARPRLRPHRDARRVPVQDPRDGRDRDAGLAPPHGGA